MFAASQGESGLRKFQSTEVRSNTMETKRNCSLQETQVQGKGDTLVLTL